MAAEAISGETVDERRVLEACLAKQRSIRYVLLVSILLLSGVLKALF